MGGPFLVVHLKCEKLTDGGLKAKEARLILRKRSR
jgi:hypothetical protein